MEIVHGDIGFSAYERYGEVLPYETFDQVSECDSLICGQTEDFGEGDNIRNPLRMLMSQMDLYARSRTFRTLIAGKGVDDLEITFWGSNINPNIDVTETETLDGITISKFIRSSFYARMMGAARSDMERKGVDDVLCIAQATLFPDSSRMFYESFEGVFRDDSTTIGYLNICDWISGLPMDPYGHSFVVASDLYLSVAESAAAGLTGGYDAVPTKFVSDDKTLVKVGHRSNPANSVSSLMAASIALDDLDLTEESKMIVDAVKNTIDSGIIPRDFHGDCEPKVFIDSVISRL